MKHPLLACLMPLLALFAGTVIAQETTESNIVPPKASQSVPAISLPPKIAFLMPPKGSKFEKASELALNGLLASNYASSQPAEVLLIRPGSLDTVKTQLEKAATAGAMVAVGPIDRQGVEEISKLAYLPLPVVTLNQVELDRPIPLTAEEIAERDRLEENRRLAKADQSEPEIRIHGRLWGPLPLPQQQTAILRRKLVFQLGPPFLGLSLRRIFRTLTYVMRPKNSLGGMLSCSAYRWRKMPNMLLS